MIVNNAVWLLQADSFSLFIGQMLQSWVRTWLYKYMEFFPALLVLLRIQSLYSSLYPDRLSYLPPSPLLPQPLAPSALR